MSYYNPYQLSRRAALPLSMPSYQVLPPVSGSYVAQASWQPRDYYNYHLTGSHTDLESTPFDYVWAKVRNAVGLAGSSRQEAAFWHKHVYSGLVDVASILPADVGAAAAYETLLFMERNPATFCLSLRHESPRGRDALMAMAIAEATKLWVYTRRPADMYGRREACEVAAATVRRLLRHRPGRYDLRLGRRTRWSTDYRLF